MAISGEPPETLSVSATKAKNEFGRILEKAIRGNRVVITKHDTPKAILLSMDEFNALSGGGGAALNTLGGELDALLAKMQTPVAHARRKAALDASPKRLGRAAVAAARKRSR